MSSVGKLERQTKAYFDTVKSARKVFDATWKLYVKKQEELRAADKLWAQQHPDDRCPMYNKFWRSETDAVRCVRIEGHEGKHRQWIGSDGRLDTWEDFDD
jgi:hypothetical protein